MGGKRVNSDVMFQPRKKCANIHHGDDWISALPDEILVVILSFLPLKEAARTSVLSSRWIDLWKYTPCLIFDGYGALADIENYNKPKILNVERRKYVNWVNSVLRSHKGFTLNEFRIDFDLDKFSQKAITKWLEFAFATRVERLELELRQYSNHSKLYEFPEKFINSSCGLCKTLKALSLKSVNVTDQAIDCFLRSCPFLEQLIVHNSSKLLNLEVSDLSRMLKHLEICNCFRLRSIKVSAPSLTSLIITAVEELTLENVPMLVNLSVRCVGQHYFKKLVPTLSCYFSQLEILELNLVSPEDVIELGKLPQLPKLKKLEVEWYSFYQSLLEFAYFVRASPHLQEFVLKLNGCRVSRNYRNIKNPVQFPHQHLKVVEFVGYYGRPGDNQLIRYMLENCVALEKIIIDPRRDHEIRYLPCHLKRLEMERTGRKCAEKQFLGKVPKHIQLVIR